MYRQSLYTSVWLGSQPQLRPIDLPERLSREDLEVLLHARHKPWLVLRGEWRGIVSQLDHVHVHTAYMRNIWR